MLYRLPAHPAVADVQEVYLGTGRWKNPWDKSERQILVYGLGAGENMLQIPGFDDARDQLQQPDVGLFDRRSRPTFGPVAEALAKGERVDVEVNHRKMTIAACTEIGVTLGVDGNLFVSDTNFLRLFPRIPGSIDLGLISSAKPSLPFFTSRYLKQHNITITQIYYSRFCCC